MQEWEDFTSEKKKTILDMIRDTKVEFDQPATNSSYHINKEEK